MLAERLTAQLLAGAPARDPVAVAERLLAVQGQDARGARLAIRARTAGLTAGDVDRALTEDRSLLITWLNRGTLHLVRSEDYSWLHALTVPPLLAAVARRLAQEGVDARQAERGVEVIERSLADEGPLTRPALAKRLSDAGVPTNGQALVHVLMLAASAASRCAGRWSGASMRMPLCATGSDRPIRSIAIGRSPSSRDATSPGTPRPTRATSRAGPGSRCATRAPASRRSRRSCVSARTACSSCGAARPPPSMPPPRLLGPYDPVLLGWTSREQIIGPHRNIVTNNGLFRPFALVDGRAVGLWRVHGGRVTIEPFARLRRATADALAAEADDVRRYLGLPAADPPRA